MAGSWIGGGANQTAMKEVFGVSDNLFATMIAVDVIVANLWMAFLLYGAGISEKVDKWFQGDASAIVYVSIEEDEEQAQDLLDLMNDKIDPSDGYTYVKEMNLIGDNHPAVYYTEGHGAHHYIWAKGDRLYWIALSGLSLTARLDFLESLGTLQ